MIRKLNQIIGLILTTKLMTWVVPDSKRFIKGIITTAIIILFVIYFHSEYLRWAEISGIINLVSTSYILKNLIILISLIGLYFYLKKTPKKAYAKVKGEEKIYTKNNNEDYFDKFRNKDKLKTKAEQILDKDDRG
ncbi:hypothetical protein N9N53_03495 [Candidatus Pelagibacter bacterium]|nr:hypothetical protein [Candidatus Pelagibacter bacterium]MDA8836035.1 hypothetical protein [Candidatus Pelagibacter bacterium]